MTKLKTAANPYTVKGYKGVLQKHKRQRFYIRMYDDVLAAGFKFRNVGDYRSYESDLVSFNDRGRVWKYGFVLQGSDLIPQLLGNSHA